MLTLLENTLFSYLFFSGRLTFEDLPVYILYDCSTLFSIYQSFFYFRKVTTLGEGKLFLISVSIFSFFFVL